MHNSSLRFGTLAVLTAGLMSSNFAFADNELWIGNPGVTATTNWSDPNNWSGTSKNPNNNTVFFGNGVATASLMTNNVVDKSTNCYALNFTNSVGYNVTFIAPGQTLTLDGNNSGPALLFTPNAATSNTNTITGANGTLLVTGSSAGGVTVTVTNSGATGNHPLLDLSGLGTFIISNADSSAAINIANSATRPGGTLNLAMTNYIVLPAPGTGGSAALVVGEATGNNGNTPGGILNLGLTNAIFAGNIGVGLSKQSAGTIQFNPAFTNSNPVAYIRGPGGSAVTNWAIGDGIGTTGTSIGPAGTVNFNNGTVNAVVSSMWLGKPSAGSASAPTAKGTLSLSAGTFSVVNLTNADAIAPTSGGAGAATGTINVNGTGILAVNNLVMAYITNGALSSTASLNVTNGTIQAGTIVGGGGSSTINLIGGTLNLTNTAGAGAQWLTALTVSNSTLQLNVPGSGVPVQVTNLTVSGTTDIVNIASMPAVVPPAQFVLIGYSVPINGTFDFGLGTLAGAYQGYISNNVNNSSVDLVITGSVSKPLVWNGNVNGNWDLATANWTSSGSSALYVQGDFVTFDDSLTGTTNVVLATNVAPGSIGFNNSSSNYVLSGPFKITGATLLSKSGSASVTLSEGGGDNFSGGITVNSGTLILDNAGSAISGGLTINGGTVQIGNNDANGALPSGTLLNNGVLAFDQSGNLTVSTIIQGSGSVVQQGSGVLTLSGANSYTNSTLVNNGTLSLGAPGAISGSAGVAINSATLSVSGLSQPATMNDLDVTNATVTVAIGPNAAPCILCSALGIGGAANSINVASLPAIASYPVTFTIIQSTNPATGSYNFTLAPLPGGATGFLSQSADQTSVLLTVTNGTIGVRGVVLWTGGDSNDPTNWTDRLDWQLPGAPVSADNVLFNSTGAASSSELSSAGAGAAGLSPYYINNVVNANFTISSLTFTNANSTAFHNTWIDDGLTLSVTGTNSLTVGNGSLDFGGATVENVAIAGTNGTFEVNNTNGTIFVGLGSTATGSHEAILDMSALGAFNASVSRFLVGVGSTSEGINEARECGVVYLAQSNTITATLAVSGAETSDSGGSAVAFDVGDNNGNAGDQCSVYLGQTNVIFADAIAIGRQKTSAQMLFNTAFNNAGALIRGQNGTGPVGTFGVGDEVVNSGTATGTGIVDFSGGIVNAFVSTMYIGRASGNTENAGTATGTLTFAGGRINAGTIYVGLEPTNNSSKHGVGTLNVVSNNISGTAGTLIVTGGLNLGFNDGGSGSESSSGTLDITNGVVKAYSIAAGTNTPSTINIAGGTLVLTNPAFSSSAPLGTLNLEPLNQVGNTATALYLPVRTNFSGITVSTLNIDGQDTTTNIINVESVGPVGAVPIELPLITYTSFNLVSGTTTNIGLGTLPTGYAGYLTNDTANNMLAVVLTAALHPQPDITGFSVSSSNVVVSGVNGFANVPYHILSSTNVASPLANWTVSGPGIFGPTGTFSFSASGATNAQQFFLLRVP